MNCTTEPSSLFTLWQKGVEKRKEFRSQFPALSSLSREEQTAKWREYIGSPNPLVPSKEDNYREASCLTCHDAKWISQQGEPIPCPNCSGWDEEKIQRALEYSGIPGAKRKCTFESFSPARGAEEAAENAHLLGADRAKFKLLLIYGGVGNGKTHLAYAAGLEAVQRGVSVRFIHVGELFSRMKLAFNVDKVSSEQILEELKICGFLILDELGIEKDSPWQQETLETLVNHRYANELPLIVTTNKAPKLLPIPIISRFGDTELSRMIANTAPNYRNVRREELCYR
ncbi:MAG: ATP-binding protein [Halobacteriota archaeon]|nr:ATP-binding protein [Halobacteriota archaeon]